jgi:O-methyltransferase involved in polyketide biosynthesis
VVGNTAMNVLASRALPDYRLLNDRYGERFVRQDMDKVQVLPSGILGGVRLILTAQTAK